MTYFLCPFDIFFESCNVGLFLQHHSSLVGQLIQALSKISVDGISRAELVSVLNLRMKMTSSPRFRVFLVLLTILSTEGCYGQLGNYSSNASQLIVLHFFIVVFSSGNCPYRYCSHLATLSCGSGGLVDLPCVVYNATGPIQVRWYHSQNAGNPGGAEELLNITAGGRYTVEESEQSPSNSRYENCTEGDQLYRNALKFNYSEGDSGSYWCRIVIGGDTPLELSEAWTVQSISGGPATCGLYSQTDPKCAGQIETIPALPSTILLAQSTPTSVVDHSPVSVATQSPMQAPGAPRSTPPSVATQSPIQTPGAPHSTPPSVATHSPMQTPGAPRSTPPSVATQSPIQTPGAPHSTPPSVATHSPMQTPGAPRSTPPSVTPTSVLGATSEPSVSVTTVTHSPVETLSATSVPSVPSSYSSSAAPSPDCGGTPCSVYGLAAGLGALTLILLVATVSVLVCVKLYLQRVKKIASKFMFPPYALRISVSGFSLYRRLSLTAWHSTEVFGNGVVNAVFSLIPRLFPSDGEVGRAWE